MAEFLTRAFFEEELDRLHAAYSEEIGAKKISILVMLRDGQALKLEANPVCTDNYVLCDFKAKGGTARAAVPYGSILAVTLSAESGGTMGFSR